MASAMLNCPVNTTAILLTAITGRRFSEAATLYMTIGATHGSNTVALFTNRTAPRFNAMAIFGTTTTGIRGSNLVIPLTGPTAPPVSAWVPLLTAIKVFGARKKKELHEDRHRRTAKALGITVPLPMSGRADELIE
jgi:hypothetical protein